MAYHNGAPVRLQDVARVIDDAENLKQAAWMNTVPAVILNVQRQPGANIITVVDKVKALLPRLQSSLPGSVKVAVLTIAPPRFGPRCRTSSSNCCSRSRWW